VNFDVDCAFYVFQQHTAVGDVYKNFVKFVHDFRSIVGYVVINAA